MLSLQLHLLLSCWRCAAGALLKRPASRTGEEPSREHQIPNSAFIFWQEGL
jgi:hypothetical protein